MKKQPKVLLSTNILTEYVPSKWSARMIQWISNIAAGQEDTAVDIGMPHILMRASYLPEARYIQLDNFLRSDATHLIIVDCDQVWPANAVSQLVMQDLPIVSGFITITNPPYHPVYKYYDGVLLRLRPPHASEIPSGGVIEVDAVGCGFTCYRRDVIEAIGPSAAIPDHSTCIWGAISEDLSICYRARMAGFKTYVDVDCPVGHIATVPVGRDEYRAYAAMEAKHVPKV